MNIRDALNQLDPEDDAHWTADGMPRMDILEKTLGSVDVTRQNVTDAAPDFTRDTARAAIAKAAAETTAATQTDAPKTPDTEDVQKDAEDVQKDAAPNADAEAATEASWVPTDEAMRDANETADNEPETAQAIKLPDPDLTELEVLERDLASETELMLNAQRVHDEAKKNADTAANKVNALNRRIELLQKRDPNHGTAGIRAYLRQQAKNREKRALGMTRFLDMTGVKATDVANAMDPRAPIDRAFNVRKPPRGSQRPKPAAAL